VNPEPVTVTTVPGWPEAGEKLEIVPRATRQKNGDSAAMRTTRRH